MYILKRRAFGICSCSYFFIYIISFNPDNNSVRYEGKILLFSLKKRKLKLSRINNLPKNRN